MILICGESLLQIMVFKEFKLMNLSFFTNGHVQFDFLGQGIE